MNNIQYIAIIHRGIHKGYSILWVMAVCLAVCTILVESTGGLDKISVELLDAEENESESEEKTEKKEIEVEIEQYFNAFQLALQIKKESLFYLLPFEESIALETLSPPPESA